MNDIIVMLIVIDNFLKDIHYTAHGASFYGKHLLVDKFNFNDDIDTLKECCLLGQGVRPLANKSYLKEAVKILSEPIENDDKKNFEKLQDSIKQAFSKINAYEGDKADNNVLDGISAKLKTLNGLLNLQVEE